MMVHARDLGCYCFGPLRTLPVALAGTKVQTLELRSADELGRLAQGNQLKTDWEINQCSVCAVEV